MTVSGRRKPRADRSVYGRRISIGGREFEKGVGAVARSVMHIDLNKGSETFSAWVGVDDEVATRLVRLKFRVLGDRGELWNSGVMEPGRSARVDLDVRNVETLVLIASPVGGATRYNHADWADAKFVVTGDKPKAVDPPVEEPVILTPPPSPEPRINSARVFGVRPGSPFLYTIAATGDRPMTFAAGNLPAGLDLDPATGMISGALNEPGEHRVTLVAENRLGKAARDLRIVVGDKLALTPPMGWNSWYCFLTSVTDKMMRDAADAMVNTGMINHGYVYVNIDDAWSMKPASDDPLLNGLHRDANGMVNSNKKFPDMNALTDYIHAKGLKAGLYTSPGTTTCAGYVGAYQHEELDAQRFAQWGFDFLKYDWCSYGQIAKDSSRAELKKPYLVMKAALDKLDRDFVYNLCQYGMGDVWEWGADVGGHCWRTTGDLGIATSLYENVITYGFSHDGREQWHGPGHYNDPDYLLIGWIHWEGALRPTPLTPNEQYTHITLWSLLSAPLIFSGDMTKLDAFTLSLLTNDEVIEVDQDPLCRQAVRVAYTEDWQVWAKEMEDGSKAVGLFNVSEIGMTVGVQWSDLGIRGGYRVRDLWGQKDIGVFADRFEMDVPRHGAAMVRLFPVQ